MFCQQLLFLLASCVFLMFYYFLRGGFRWGPPLFLLPLSLFGQFVGQEQGIEAGFVDSCNQLISTRGCHFDRPFIFVVNVFPNCLGCIGVTQHLGHILANELRLVVDGVDFLYSFVCCPLYAVISSASGRSWARIGSNEARFCL